MSSLTRRAALTVLRSHRPLRTYASSSKTPSPPERVQISDDKDSPYKMDQPVFPPPSDPFSQTPPQMTAVPEAKPAPTSPRYSDGQMGLIKGLARIMGYNSKASTAIRETRRMMGGIVEALEEDTEFWYGECQLPPTYQSFFQLHLLYILILIPRLRALPASSPTHTHPMPEPPLPSPPHSSPSTPSSTSPPLSNDPSVPINSSSPPSSSSSSSSPVSPFTKPAYDRYVSELIDHFFGLAETQMRRVLGRGERERVVKKYMKEIGEQYRGANVAFDYTLGLGMSYKPEERVNADTEMASWVWRNLFASRGLGPPTPDLVAEDEVDAYTATEMVLPEQLDIIVSFIRREMARLDSISDQDVLDGSIGQWGRVREGTGSSTIS